MLAFIMGQKSVSLQGDLVHVIISNAIDPLMVSLGVRIIFLPPYSPDLNPIEEAFSKIKSWIRRNHDLFVTAGDGIFYDLREVLDIITADDAEGYIRHSGYF
jgi:transposase